MVVLTNHGNNTYDVQRPGWGANRKLTKITNINPDLVGQIGVDDTVVVGYYNGNPQQAMILSKAGFMFTAGVSDLTVAAIVYAISQLQWPRVGRIEPFSRDTTDRNGTDEGAWELPTELVKYADGIMGCARVANSRIWFLRLDVGEGDWVLHVVHFDENFDDDEDTLILDHPTSSMMPLMMTLQPVGVTEAQPDGADFVDVYTSWCGRVDP